MLVYQRVFYKIKGQSPIFRHTPSVCPKDFDEVSKSKLSDRHSNCPSGTKRHLTMGKKTVVICCDIIESKAKIRYLSMDHGQDSGFQLDRFD